MTNFFSIVKHYYQKRIEEEYLKQTMKKESFFFFKETTYKRIMKLQTLQTWEFPFYFMTKRFLDANDNVEVLNSF